MSPLLADLQHPTEGETVEDAATARHPVLAAQNVEDGQDIQDVQVVHDGGANYTPVVDAGDRVQTRSRVLLIAFAVFTLLAVNALLVLAGHTDSFFAWTIQSRPNAAFLGAAYGAGFILSVLALRQRLWSQVRVAVVTVTAFTVLTLFPTLLHMHRLHLMADSATARAAAWIWVGVYLLIPVACVTVVVRQKRAQSERAQSEEAVRRPMPKPLVILLAVQGTALAVAGAILYGGGSMSHMMVEMQRPGWPWPVTPLTSQVIGAWLLSFGFAIAVAIRERDLGRMFVPSVAYAAFGVFELLVLLTYRNALETDGRWLWLDLGVLATVAATGAYGAWVAHRLR